MKKNMTVGNTYDIRCHKCDWHFTVARTDHVVCPHCAVHEIARLEKVIDLAEKEIAALKSAAECHHKDRKYWEADGRKIQDASVKLALEIEELKKDLTLKRSQLRDIEYSCNTQKEQHATDQHSIHILRKKVAGMQNQAVLQLLKIKKLEGYQAGGVLRKEVAALKKSCVLHNDQHTNARREIEELREKLDEANALLARKENHGENGTLFESILSMEKALKDANITIVFNERGIVDEKQ